MPPTIVCRQPHPISLWFAPFQVRGDINPWFRHVIDPLQADQTCIIVEFDLLLRSQIQPNLRSADNHKASLSRERFSNVLEPC